MSKYLIGLDDGHGINTAGKRTVKLKEDLVFNGNTRKKGTEIHENEFNEVIMRKVEPHLKRCGVDYIELAPTTADTPLSTRANTANENKCDIVISIHANALIGDKWQNKAYGLVVIKTRGCQSKTDKFADIAYKYLKQVDFPGDGETKYGVRIDTEISGFTLAILRQTTMPSILVELGFMDNWEDVKVMCSENFQNECAIAIALTICEYFGIAYNKEPNTVTFKPYVVRIITNTLNIRNGSSVTYDKVGELHKGDAYTIVEEKGSWGKLKSGQGWICLSKQYVEKVK